jgi:hypothetical protein
VKSLPERLIALQSVRYKIPVQQTSAILPQLIVRASTAMLIAEYVEQVGSLMGQLPGFYGRQAASLQLRKASARSTNSRRFMGIISNPVEV